MIGNYNQKILVCTETLMEYLRQMVRRRAPFSKRAHDGGVCAIIIFYNIFNFTFKNNSNVLKPIYIFFLRYNDVNN